MKKRYIIAASIMFLLLISISISYAYFTLIVKNNGNINDVKIQLGTMEVLFTDGREIALDKVLPGSKVEKQFSVTNIGDMDAVYSIQISDVINTFVNRSDLRYEIRRLDDDINSIGILPRRNGTLVFNQTIGMGKTHTYTFEIDYLNTNVNQSEDIGKVFSGKIQVAGFVEPTIMDTAKENTLLYAIGKNEMVEEPLTKLGEDTAVTYLEPIDHNDSYTSSQSGQRETSYIAYSSSYIVDPIKGYILGPDMKVEKYSDAYPKLKGKYITLSGWANIAGTAEQAESFAIDLYGLKRVNSATATSITTTNLERQVVSREFIFSQTSDNFGSAYYYRGGVNTNYVKFANMCWRILNISGNGNVKLILESQNNSCLNTTSKDALLGKIKYNEFSNDNTYVGYMYGTPNSKSYATTHSNLYDSTIKTFLDGWYESNILPYESYTGDVVFCNDRTVYKGSGVGAAYTEFWNHYQNTKNEYSLQCKQKNDSFSVNDDIGNGLLNYPIGLPTNSELQLAGNNQPYEYLKYETSFWTMSPTSTGNVNYPVNNTYTYVRPVIGLKGNVKVIGIGTAEHPYEVVGI